MTWSQRRPVRRTWWGATGVAVVTLALAGCGYFTPASTPTTTSAPALTDGPTGSTPTTSTAPPASSAASAPSATPTTTDTAVARLEGGNGLSLTLILPDAAAPPGWQTTEARDTGGYRMNVCGVDLEPNAPVDGAQKRWEQTPSGPYLEQHVRTYSDQTAQTVLASLRRALPDCTSYAPGGGGETRYTVTPRPVSASATDTVAWRQRLDLPAGQTTAGSASPTPTPSPSGSATTPVLVQEVAVTRRGSSIVLLASYAVDATPQPQVLDRALQALYALR